MRKSLWVLCAFLTGCAAATPQIGGQPDSPEKADAIYRARLHVELAANYFSRGQHGVALEELNEALRSDASFAPAYNMLGLVYMELREDKQAEQSFEQALRLSPNDSETHNNYGWFLCDRDRPAQSIPHFMAALKNPLYATPQLAYVNAGICARKQGDLNAAEKYLQSALKIQPLQPQALLQMADLSFTQGRYDDAKIHLGRYTQVAAPTAESLWLAVRLERKLGNRDAEASHGLQLRKQFPDSPQAKLLKSGRYE